MVLGEALRYGVSAADQEGDYHVELDHVVDNPAEVGDVVAEIAYVSLALGFWFGKVDGETGQMCMCEGNCKKGRRNTDGRDRLLG